MAIRVVPYDAEWTRWFEEERAVLERVLAPWLEGGIHHVGSTAIAGIAHHFEKCGRFGLHLTEPGSDVWRERLAFRDLLRGDPALAAEYEALKVRLAQEHPDDVTAYTAGKREFVARVLATVGLEPGRR